jgi:hypothetical protein
LGQVAGEAFQGTIACLGLGIGNALAATDLLDSLIHSFPGDASTLQETGGWCAAFTQYCQEDMFSGNIFVFSLLALVSKIDNPFDAV